MTWAIPYRQRLPLGIAALGFAFLGMFLIYPLFQVFSASFLDAEGTALTFSNYTKMLGRPFYRAAIANTLEIGVAATLITTLLAVPFAFALARLPIPGKSAILAMASLPLILPSFVSAYALVLLLGRSGVVTQWLQAQGVGFGSIYGMGGVVLVYTLTLYPYVLLPAIAAFKAVDVSMEEAAQNLGSSPGRTIFTVTLPIVLPAVAMPTMVPKLALRPEAREAAMASAVAVRAAPSPIRWQAAAAAPKTPSVAVGCQPLS